MSTVLLGSVLNAEKDVELASSQHLEPLSDYNYTTCNSGTKETLKDNPLHRGIGSFTAIL